MPSESQKQWGIAPLFDPEDGVTVMEPPGNEIGFWVGGCSAVYDPDTEKFYLYYRVRQPIGQGRGGVCHIAESSDGQNFTNVWTGTKEQFDSESIESAALVKSLEGKFRLYISYVNNSNRKWDIAMLEGDNPRDFDAANRTVVMRAGDVDDEGVKDPYVAIVGRQYYMFTHYAPKSIQQPGATQEQLHGTGNVFATSYGRGSSGLAISSDGISFKWVGDVLPPGESWDRKLTRIDTMVYEPPAFTIFYSGRSTVEETYEDRTGIAVSLDLRHFDKLTDDAPILESPHATGSLRYSDAVVLDDEILYYYEYSRADGSHEIRMNRVKR